MSKQQRERPSYPLEKRPGHHEGYEASHPAFGIIEISRVQGRFPNLVGVDFPQGHAVALRLKRGRMYRSYGETRWFEEGLVTEVYMSEVQFAQAISSLNSAERVPVTFRYYPDGDKLFDPGEPPVHMTDIEGMEEEVVQPLETGIQALEEAIALAKNSKVKKAIIEAMEKSLMELTLNHEFRAEQARKGIRKAADKAKMEVTAFAQQVVRQFGLTKLGADKGLLMETPAEPTTAIEHHEEED